jgi:hypothetical protein
MRIARLMIGALGAVPLGYGGWLLWAHLPVAAAWLLAGPLLHDALVAPLVGVVGLVLARLLPDRLWRRLVVAGLVTTAVLALIAVPLVLRPHAAGPNPGLQDRDYLAGLTIWIGLLWIGLLAAGLLVGGVVRPARRRAGRRRPAARSRSPRPSPGGPGAGRAPARPGADR